MPRSWIHSVYRRIGFSIRTGTTTRPPVPKGLYDACKRDYLSDITDKRRKYNIPPQLVVNADQTPSSYVSVGKRTMDPRGSRAVPIKGLSDKKKHNINFGNSTFWFLFTFSDHLCWQN